MAPTASRQATSRPPASHPPASRSSAILGDADFRYVTELARQRTGIQLNDGKRDLVQARLVKRLRVLGLSGVKEYVDLLRSPKGEEEMVGLVNALTTNVTAFYRERHHFDHLASVVAAPWRARGGGRLRLWSAACSTGEEPYSMALTLLKTAPDAVQRGARILATDLDTTALDRADAGLYRGEAVRGAVPAELRRHFEPCGQEHVTVGREPRALVSFGHLNLLEPWPVKGPFDAIFCRNVMIYFDRETKTTLCGRLAALLRPGGFLYLGHSESLLDRRIPLRPVGGTIYQRIAPEGEI
ncbi:chemotaxis protein methyltransferase CheR [Azospirillum agricola]|uniref:CheR family methyltransferase n=1 Tax=Azospirillum agricola TaxID=1720247 RepID=UPI001AE89B63|nr:protein-glutamate O-methyltransferase [Azospirillum agricola]MBP2228773.1 chemotaxis protein methyltransferase CheR [Azospirillum agricola]